MLVTHVSLPGIAQRIPVLGIAENTHGGGFVNPVMTRKVLDEFARENAAVTGASATWIGDALVWDECDGSEPTTLTPGPDGYVVALGLVFADASDERERGSDPHGVEAWQDEFGWYVSVPPRHNHVAAAAIISALTGTDAHVQGMHNRVGPARLYRQVHPRPKG